MLKIRLQRTGRRNDPSYRVIVAEHTTAPKDGNFIERLGFYNPRTKERELNADRIKYWLSVGAQASGTMHNMLVSEGIVSGSKVNVLPKKTVPVKEEEATEEAAAPAAEAAPEAEVSAEAAEAPAEAQNEEAPAEAAAEDAPTEEEAKEEEKPAA